MPYFSWASCCKRSLNLLKSTRYIQTRLSANGPLTVGFSTYTKAATSRHAIFLLARLYYHCLSIRWIHHKLSPYWSRMHNRQPLLAAQNSLFFWGVLNQKTKKICCHCLVVYFKYIRVAIFHTCVIANNSIEKNRAQILVTSSSSSCSAMKLT